jgi:hypothetical protein
MARKYTISPDSESVIETKGEGIAGDAPRTVVEVRATTHDWTIEDRRRRSTWTRGGIITRPIDHLDDPFLRSIHDSLCFVVAMDGAFSKPDTRS